MHVGYACFCFCFCLCLWPELGPIVAWNNGRQLNYQNTPAISGWARTSIERSNRGKGSRTAQRDTQGFAHSTSLLVPHSLSLFVTHKRRADDVDDQREDQLNQGLQTTGKKLPVMTHCSAVEAEDGGQNGVWARVLRGSLVGHRLCLGLCVYFVLSWVWGTSEGCRPDNGYTCALPLPLLQPQTCPFVRLND